MVSRKQTFLTFFLAPERKQYNFQLRNWTMGGEERFTLLPPRSDLRHCRNPIKNSQAEKKSAQAHCGCQDDITPVGSHLIFSVVAFQELNKWQGLGWDFW